MIAAKQHALGREALFLGDSPYQRGEVGRLHAGVTAVLIDLVGRRFDQREGVVTQRRAERGAQDQRMRRADRDGDTALAAPVAFELSNKFVECIHGKPRNQRAASLRKASSSANVAVPSIGPFFNTAFAPLATA